MAEYYLLKPNGELKLRDGEPIIRVRRSAYAPETVAAHPNGTPKMAIGKMVDLGPLDEDNFRIDEEIRTYEYDAGEDAVLIRSAIIPLTADEKSLRVTPFRDLTRIARIERNVVAIHNHLKQFEDPAIPGSIVPRLEVE